MPEIGIIPTGYERTLPPEAQLLVRARRRELLRRASGRVLDLGGSDSHRALWATSAARAVTVLDGPADPRLGELVAGGERVDTVVSVFQLASSPDLGQVLAQVREVLADDGRLLFLEPGRLVGFAGRLQRAIGPPLGSLTGWRPDRDVPMALRRAGLSVTDLERHRVPTLQPWLRQVVEGVAHRALEPGGGTAP
jgi:SAM-dependent methyltransferase